MLPRSKRPLYWEIPSWAEIPTLLERNNLIHLRSLPRYSDLCSHKHTSYKSTLGHMDSWTFGIPDRATASRLYFLAFIRFVLSAAQLCRANQKLNEGKIWICVWDDQLKTRQKRYPVVCSLLFTQSNIGICSSIFRLFGNTSYGFRVSSSNGGDLAWIVPSAKYAIWQQTWALRRLFSRHNLLLSVPIYWLCSGCLNAV